MGQEFNRCMLIIYGPTGVGKTDCALSIAQQIPAEIINADVGQFYTPLSIGTAKPAWRDEPVPHHLFDIVDEPKDITVTQYREKIGALLQQVWERNKLPILVGGSGFYLMSLFFPPEGAVESVDSSLDNLTNEQLWHKLKEVDPERAMQLYPQDTYRIRRALEIWRATGKKPSAYKPTYNPIAKDFYLLQLTRDRKELYERINQRTEIMIQEGWLDEVRPLIGTSWEPFLLKKKLIGYDDIIRYLKTGDISPEALQNLIDIIAQKTRKYAKRQETFWHMLQKKIQSQLTSDGSLPKCESFNLTLSSLEVCIKQLLTVLMKCIDQDTKE